MNFIFAGIGSRETPKYVQLYMIKTAEYLGDFTLRSGHADGADKAFEKGCDNVGGKKEIYLPWKKFNGSDSELYNISDEAFAIAEKYHPAWDKLSDGAKKLMARDCMQVLGEDLNTPADFILCWTKNGKITGGTGQALRIAIDYKIPIFNFGNYIKEDELKKALTKFFRMNIRNKL